MIPTQNELKQAYANAPQAVKDFIASPQLVRAFDFIYLTHKLHLDETDALSRALNAVFLERVSFTEFPALLKEALTKNPGVHAAVLAEVNTRIFSVFREYVKTGNMPDAPAHPEHTAPPNKLETPVFEAEERVTVAPPQETRTYSKDPYREPIE